MKPLLDRTARGGELAWLALAALIVSSCGSELSRAEENALRDLERMAFVPPAECFFPPLTGPALTCANSEALLVDRFEVTRAEWRAWRERTRAAMSSEESEFVDGWTADTDRWPASFMTLFEAREFAAARGMRLLTSQEWIRVACGPGRQPWPWGPSAASAVTNSLDLELYRPVAVGTFEQGRSPELVYDLIGNVWEWVDEPMAWPVSDNPGDLEWTMGGSYLSKLGRLYERVKDPDGTQRWDFNHQDLDPRTRSCDVGLRCAAEAASYLRRHARDWGTNPAARRRLTAIGNAWGRDAVPLLEDLVGGPEASAGLAALLDGARK
jgi:hypothetical protein